MSPTPPPAKPPTAALSDAARASSAALVLRLLRIAWRYKLGSLKIIALQVFLLAMALSGLGLTGLGVDVIKSGFDGATDTRYPLGITPPTGWSTMQQVLAIAGAIFVIAALRFALDRWALVSKAELVQDIVVDLRAQVYDKLQRLSFRFFDANESGSIINRVTGDVQAVRMFVDAVLIEVLMLLISLVFFLGYMLSLHVWLTVWCLITTPLLWVLTAYFSRLVKPAYRTNRELFDRAVRVLSENAQGVHVVKGFSRQGDEIEKFRAASQAVTDQKHWIFNRVSVFVPLISFVPQLNLVVLLGYGGYLTVYDPSFTFGAGLIVFASLLQQFSTQVGNIAQIANSLQQSLTGAQRVFEVLDSPVEVQSPPDAVPLPRARGHIRFERVGFRYADGTEALRDVDLEVQPGECVAILGATGAGKSTLMSLIPRFYDPTEGRVLIDGVDARRYDLDDLRRSVGIVFQESFLFSNTVAANIAFGHPGATPEMIERAATVASAHGFITTELPRGYDSVLTEAGSNLSGGQRQRIAIARAILTEPPILLMDDPTAAIDPETEHEIMGAINAALAGRTTFIVAHRLSTLKRADRVVVMEHGRIIQTGTHDELMESSGHYRKVARLQIADDESKRLLGLPTGGAA